MSGEAGMGIDCTFIFGYCRTVISPPPKHISVLFVAGTGECELMDGRGREGRGEDASPWGWTTPPLKPLRGKMMFQHTLDLLGTPTASHLSAKRFKSRHRFRPTSTTKSRRLERSKGCLVPDLAKPWTRKSGGNEKGVQFFPGMDN